MRKTAAGAIVGAAAAAIVLGADALFTRTAGAGRNPIELVELKTYDWRMRATARPAEARHDIALVEIDEGSLRDLQPFAGRWPWPRVVHAMLIRYLARGGAKVVAYDVNFADADTRAAFDFDDRPLTGAQSDRELADAVKAAGNVVLLADAVFDAPVANAAPVPDAGYPLDVPGVIDRKSILPPVDILASSAAAFGHNLFVLDPDGPIRHVVPFVRSGGRAVPSLGVAAALRVAGVRPNDVHLDGSVLRLGDRRMPLQSRRVASSEGTLEYLWGLIDFRGPALGADLKTRTYRTYQIVDLIKSEAQLEQQSKPDVDPSTFRDNIVFVGATASGLRDVFETPFANGNTSGIFIHAAVADDVLSRRAMTAAPAAVRIATVVASAISIGVAATIVPAWWATFAAIVYVALFGWAATILFANGRWIDLSQPVLASSFALFGGVAYQYFVEGREKRKMKKLFGQYVSKDVYDHLVADPSLARLGGARREMTVLFSDIRGFTTVSERGQPEDIVHTLNEYFTKMVEIVFAHRGTVDKFVGDMVMALFGAPLDDPRHADHAVEAALDMLDELRRLNERWQAEGRPALDIGIGINTGPMIAGNIGSEQIMSYTVIGDAVNLGSRLESLNKQYGTRIIISEATKSHLIGRYEFRPLGDVVVKGKTQPVAIFEVVGRTAAATQVDSPEDRHKEAHV